MLRDDPSTFEVLNLCKYFQNFIKYIGIDIAISTNGGKCKDQNIKYFRFPFSDCRPWVQALLLSNLPNIILDVWHALRWLASGHMCIQ